MIESNFIAQIDNSWTLFLDRDGVLNHEKNQDYIRSVEEFEFYDGVLEGLKNINQKFGTIVIVTNQRGIGRGLMTTDDLQEIHNHMMASINLHGGRIDNIYFAPYIDNESFYRKPNIGMGLQAKDDYPNIDFAKSIMIGNNISDMEFGKRLGMSTVFVETTKKIDGAHEMIDLKLESFPSFCKLFDNK